MNAGSSVLKKIETVLGGFDASKYMTKRKWATASDGTQIPLSIVYRKDLMKIDGSDPLLLYGYGSYEPFAMTGWRLGYGLLWSSVLFYTCTQIWELSKSVFQEKEDGCEHKTHEKSQTSSIFIYIFVVVERLY